MSEAVFYVLMILVPLGILWLIILSDLVTRSDLKVWRKLLWGILALLFAEIAAIAYLLSRPFNYPEDSAHVRDDEESSRTREFLTVARRHTQGEVSDDEWEAFKSGLLA